LPDASAAVAAAPEGDAFFPIMPYNHVPSDPAVLKKMADCGITVAGSLIRRTWTRFTPRE
jgi:hypothetical protein